MENKRIFICGPSGTGKSTLAEWISKTYRIPYITTSSKPLWEKYSIKSHLDLIEKCATNADFAKEFQWELLSFREKAIGAKANFVTDRSPIDNVVYYLMQVAHMSTSEETHAYIQKCHELMEAGNKIIYIPFNHGIELEDDNMRVNNSYYQLYTSSVFDHVLQTNILELHNNYHNNDIMCLTEWDWNIRMNRVNWLLTEKNPIEKWLRKKLSL